MKNQFFFILSTVLLMQEFSYALPGGHDLAAAALAENIEMPELDELKTFAVSEFLGIGNFTIQKHVTFFKTIIPEAEKSELNLSKEVNKLKDFINEVEALDKIEDNTLLEKTFQLFEKSSEITKNYDLNENKSPSNEQTALAKIFEEKGFQNLETELTGYLQNLRTRFISKTKIAINSWSEDEKKKHNNIIKWLKELQDEEESEKILPNIMESIMWRVLG